MADQPKTRMWQKMDIGLSDGSVVEGVEKEYTAEDLAADVRRLEAKLETAPADQREELQRGIAVMKALLAQM